MLGGIANVPSMPPPHWPFVPEVVEPFREKFDACEALIDFSVKNYPSERFAVGVEKPRPEVLVSRTYLRSTKTYQAALRLAFIGYGVQSSMLGRTLFEDMAVSYWIRRHPSEAIPMFDRHGLFQFGERARLARKYDLPYPADEWDELPPEDRDKIATEFRRSQTWWKTSLYRIVEDIQEEWFEEERITLWSVFDHAYHRVNNVLHHSRVALSPTIEETPEGVKVGDLGPSTAYLWVALPLMFFSYAWFLGLVFEGEALERLFDLFRTYADAFA